jgi:Flp pilus assembly protein TadD
MVMLRNLSYALLISSSLTFVTYSGFAADNSFFDRLQPAGASAQQTNAGTSALHEKIKSNNASPEEYLNLAASLRSGGNPEDAASVLQKAQKKFPDNTDILRQFGITLIDANQPIQAIEVFDVLAAIEPHNAMAYNGKAVGFDTAGNHVAALEIYEKALSLAPTSVAIRNNMAMSYALNDQLSDAQILLETLFAEAPDVPKIRHNLALVYGLQGNSKQAMDLNLQTLSQQQAEENLKFYQRYASIKKDYKPVELMTQEGQPLDDLFTEIPSEAPESNTVASEKIDSPAVQEMQTITEVSPSAGVGKKEKTDIANDAETTAQSTHVEEQPEKTNLFGADAEYRFPTGKRY